VSTTPPESRGSIELVPRGLEGAEKQDDQPKSREACRSRAGEEEKTDWYSVAAELAHRKLISKGMAAEAKMTRTQDSYSRLEPLDQLFARLAGRRRGLGDHELCVRTRTGKLTSPELGGKSNLD
jgi:hypothetical protein